MRFKVNAREFQDAIKKVEKFIPKGKTSLPIIKNIKLVADTGNNKIILIATDASNVLRINIDTAEVNESGALILSKDNLNLIKKLDRSYRFEFVDNKVEGIVLRNKFSTDDFFTPDELYKEMDKMFIISSSYLKELLTVKYAIADKNNYYDKLKGYCFNGNQLVTSDSFRLALRNLVFDTNMKNTVVDSSLEILNKIIDKKSTEDFTVYKNKYCVQFVSQSIELNCRILDSQFVNYKDVIPSHSNYIEVNRNFLLDGLEYLKGLSNNHIVIMKQKDDELIMTIKDEDNTITKKIPILDYPSKEKIIVASNINFWIDTLKNYNCQIIKISYDSKLKPLVIEETDKLDLILPVRLKDDIEDVA